MLPEHDSTPAERGRISITLSTTKLLFVSALVAVIALIGGNVVQALGAQDADAAHRSQVSRMRALHADEVATVKETARTEQERAVKAAVAKQKRHDVRVLRRAVRKQRSRRTRETRAARVAGESTGYASGSAAGYSNGHSDGQQDGLIQGSDGLTCSDDVDVYWLPACSY